MADVLSALSTESLEDLYYHDHPDKRGDETKPKKKEIVDAISDKLDAYAIELFLTSLSLPALKNLAEKTKVVFKEDDNKKSRGVVMRRLTKQIVTAGFDGFLATVDADTLKAVADDFDVKADKKAVAEAARESAADRYFNAYDVESLRALATDLKLKQAAKSQSKRKLVDAILAQEDVEASEPKKKKQKKVDVGKKKPLEKGITYDEIFQHYYAQELREFVKKNGIKISGKKPVLIKRILSFLDGETDGIMADEKKQKKGAKKTSTAAAKGKGKGKTTEAKGEKEENGN